MSQFVIYEHPRDFPNHFVVRRWDIVSTDVVAEPRPSMVAYVFNTLEAARSFIPAGYINIGVLPGDDSVIREVWI